MTRDDPAFDLPLPAVEYLDAAARMAGFTDWFSVPTLFRTDLNRRIIVNARLLARKAA